MTTVDDAFRWARIHAVRHMAACEVAGLRWGETSVTEIVTARAAKAVKVVPFTQNAEALSGADWVWWWVDGRGSYGMLVQAKRVTVTRCKWKFDFSYPKDTGRQRSTLMSVARTLEILPVYALYLGSGDYRRWEPCPDGHQRGRCLPCLKRSVSLMPASLANGLLVDNSSTTYERSVALEDLWMPPASGAMLNPELKEKLNPDLLNFLKLDQHGTRAVTRAMIDRVLRVRAGAFQSSPVISPRSVRNGARDRLGSIFPDLPDDFGHFDLNFFHHVLDPLRHAPPDYVLEVMSGDFDEVSLASRMPENIAGIIVARLGWE